MRAAAVSKPHDLVTTQKASATEGSTHQPNHPNRAHGIAIGQQRGKVLGHMCRVRQNRKAGKGPSPP